MQKNAQTKIYRDSIFSVVTFYCITVFQSYSHAVSFRVNNMLNPN